MTEVPHPAADEADRLPSSTVSGTAELRRVGLFRFPVFELAVDGQVVARLGRSGSWRIFFGRGQVIELADGTRWRLRAIGSSGAICPVIVDADGKKVGLASPHVGGYGINGPDWAYVMYGARRSRLIRPSRWILREHEDDVAVVTRTPRAIVTEAPVPLAAAILCLTLTTHSIPGESDLGVPSFSWRTN